MARAQQSGLNATAVGLIVCVVLFLTSTILLVLQYTENEDLKNQAAKATSDKSRAVSPSEERSIEVIKVAQANGPTMVGLLEEERSTMAELVDGDPKALASSLKSKRESFVEQLLDEKIVESPNAFSASDSMFAITEKLYREIRNKNDILKEARDNVNRLSDEVDQEIAKNAEQKSEFEKRIQSLRDQITRMESERSKFYEDTENEVQQITQNFENRRKQNEEELLQASENRKEAEQKLVTVQERLAALEAKYGEVMIKPQDMSTAREPDGEIVTAVPGDEVVYISLGREDRMTLGVQFTVYSYETGIPASGEGKGRIEVIEVFENSSMCKVNEVFDNAVIFANDLIANPVYDRNRAPTFLVLGEFDLDYDDILDSNGNEVIRSVIQEWGGKVVDDISALTDFVVLGVAPVKPGALGEASAAEAVLIDAQRRRYEQYNNNFQTARDLNVPIMTQNVFLRFLGYSGRDILN